MAKTTFTCRGLVTGTNLGTIPLVGSYGKVLNRAGELSGTIDCGRRPPAIVQGYLDATIPRRTVIWVDRDKTLMNGYIIWSRQWLRGSRFLYIRGASLWSYFLHRRLRVTKSFPNDDQLAIAKWLIDYAQAQPGGNIGIAVPAATSGVLRQRNPIGYDFELKFISTLVEQLAGVINGFDFDIACAYDTAEVPTATFQTYYPRRGRTADASGISFTFGANLLDLSYLEDEVDRPNTMLGVGAGEDVTQLEAPVVDASELDNGFPLLEASYVRKNIYETDTLNDNAGAALRQKQDSDRLVLWVKPDHVNAPVGAYEIGDDVNIAVPPRRHPRFPNGFNRPMRILGQTIQPKPTNAPDEVQLVVGAARG